MTKVIDDYIFELEQDLSGLPEKERQDVLEFYREFLLDGDFVRRSTIEQELGTPKQLSIKILADYSTNSDSASVKATTPRSNLKAIWYILLGICAAPIGIPLILLIFAFLAVCLAFLVTLAVIVFTFFLKQGFLLVKAIALLFTGSWAAGSLYLGKALIAIGIVLLLLPWLVKSVDFLIAKCTTAMRNLGKNVLKKNYFQTNKNHKEN
ncbi:MULTISPECIES: DUF1700 domain-containing protein [Lactobacillus]|uniref:DUF1700 domain-containing protein n=1 Tax=Lactobacillus apis TaxID=303541 RepID=A0A0F4LU10_9LACO|nr:MULTISPECIES: DUF1700 domain-containing protein [Lactobacillus]KJY62100.1 hypothetical protein JF72_00800 [Lactobacillus apis]MBI0022788.1 DUF1700 domain-containing protein [Lactobacillus sp. W8172]